MIANMRGGARVRSVMLPYHCGQCKKDREHVLDLETGGASKIETEMPCPACGHPMHFDDLAESYLSFHRGG
jgi:DNA-directed RNA polymerase subunit RPC12/RpoP